MNLILTAYLFFQNNRTNKLIEYILNNYSINIKDVINSDKYESNFTIDKDMIGLKYPEIFFDKIKSEYIKGKIISSICEFLTQLEIKLLYLEKEINRIISYYKV